MTVDVGAVEKPFEDSEVRDVPKEATWPEPVELSDMQDIEPFPVPLYVLALARPAFANDCDDAMRCRPAANRARPFSLSGCSAICCALVEAFAVSVVAAIICTESVDELAILWCLRSQNAAQAAQDARMRV